MKIAAAFSMLLFVCLMNAQAQTPAQFAEIWDNEHVSNIFPSNVRHKDLQNYLAELTKIGVKVDEVGRSYAGREIYQVEWGKGPFKVFLWSQMHGDEPTATSALIDIFTVLQKNRDKQWVQDIENAVTIRAVPMLNPDGAGLFTRRNLQGIDINRDALDLKTPEARLLKRLRDEWSPDMGFNLHNQNSLTTVGETAKQAAISLLVVYGDAARTESEGFQRNKRVASAMLAALNTFIPGNVGKYDDEFTATAFGDNFSAWGTPVILIETGSLSSQDEMYLVKMNFVAILTALKKLADGSEKNFSPANYDMLTANSSGRLMSIIFRGATVLNGRTTPPSMTTADIGINLERRRAEFRSPGMIRRIGDLSKVAAIADYDASGFVVVGRFMPIAGGSFAELLFYRKGRQIDWSQKDLEKKYPPDAIFSFGKFITGEGVVPRRYRRCLASRKSRRAAPGRFGSGRYGHASARAFILEA